MILCGTVGAAEAAVRTWTGAAGDWDYGNAANWASSALPANNDYADTAVFSADATPGTVNLVTPFGSDMTPTHEAVTFASAGWTINFRYESLGVINSAGEGTNTLIYSFECQQNATWTIGAGNTLFFDGGLYLRDKHITLVGGGTVLLDTALSGYGSPYVYGLHVADALLKFDTTSLYTGAATGKIYIQENGVLQFKGTVASATSLIGTRIIDESGKGLTITDIGDGYVQVSVPEPTGMMAAALIAGAAVLRRRRVATA